MTVTFAAAAEAEAAATPRPTTAAPFPMASLRPAWAPFRHGLQDPAALARRTEAEHAVLPTREELAWLKDDSGWLSYCRFAVHHTGLTKDAFVYSAQPGRLGVVLAASSGQVGCHSAVAATLERSICVVDSVDLKTGRDAWRVVPTDVAKGDARLKPLVAAVHELEVEQANLVKARQSVGILSVAHQSALAASAGRCFVEPFVYVRWLESSRSSGSASSYIAVALSNGRCQVLGLGDCEMRFKDPRRVFTLRPDGRCEAINVERSIYGPIVSQLLRGNLLDMPS